jgi:AcrR family transcriptional regulator
MSSAIPAHRSAAGAPRPTRRTAAVRPFAEVLQEALDRHEDRRKGARTRDRLRVAAVQALEARGYTRLRVSDICTRAQVSPAAFYQYFANREAITVEVLSDFMRATVRPAQPVAPAASRFEALYAANLAWVASARVNAGLMRCLLQLGDEVPSFRTMTERLNAEWYEHVTDAILRGTRAGAGRRRAVRLAVQALGGMMDDLARGMLLAPGARVRRVLREAAPTDEALAEFLSVLWHRALYGREPEQVQHAASRALLVPARRRAS